MLYLCLLIIEDYNLPLQSQFSRILIVQRVNEVREDWRHKVSAAGRGDTQISKGKAFLFCFVLFTLRRKNFSLEAPKLEIPVAKPRQVLMHFGT